MLNWLVLNANINEWEGGILKALEALEGKGTEQIPPIALVEPSERRHGDILSTGEVQRSIIWTDSTDKGDVSANRLIVGNLEFYYSGLRRHDAGSVETATNIERMEYGRCKPRIDNAFGRWPGAAPTKSPKRPPPATPSPPLKSRVPHMASEMRILEYERATNDLIRNEPGQLGEKAAQAAVRDIIASYHDGDFRLWSLFNGFGAYKYDVFASVAELTSSSTATRVYNYQHANVKKDEKNTFPLLSHR